MKVLFLKKINSTDQFFAQRSIRHCDNRQVGHFLCKHCTMVADAHSSESWESIFSKFDSVFNFSSGIVVQEEHGPT